MCWHKWGKWEKLVRPFFRTNKDGSKTEWKEDWQKRVCLKCNYTEMEEI